MKTLHDKVTAVLDSYSQGWDESEEYETTEPEDVWRLFRDLRKVLTED